MPDEPRKPTWDVQAIERFARRIKTQADIIVTSAGVAIIVRADLRMRLATTWGRGEDR